MSDRLFAVTLRAEEICVTADNESDAERYAAEDAHQFCGDWAYSVDQVRVACSEVLREFDAEGPTDDRDDLSFEVECRDGKPGREQTWTFDGLVTVVVAAPDEREAGTRALALPHLLCYGAEKAGLSAAEDPEDSPGAKPPLGYAP